MDNDASIGYAHARLEILKISWNDLRATLYEVRGAGIEVEGIIDYAKLQIKFASALGKLNDITHQQKNKQSTNIKLPEIKLPQFDGSPTAWKTYIELFNKIVQHNASLSKAIKMQYLKTSLTGDAAKLVGHLPPNAENYDPCYELLFKRYNNKREILGQLLDSILKLPKHQNENSKELKLLHDTTFECVMAIRNIGIETKNWDPLLNHIFIHKLTISSDTIKTYECQLANIREPQSLKEFLEFIENRFMAISSAENKSESTENFKSTTKYEYGASKKGSQNENACIAIMNIIHIDVKGFQN